MVRRNFLQNGRENENRVLIEADHLRVARNPQNPRGPGAPLLAEFRNLYMQRIEQQNSALFPVVGIFDCDYVNVHPINRSAITAAVRFL